MRVAGEETEKEGREGESAVEEETGQRKRKGKRGGGGGWRRQDEGRERGNCWILGPVRRGRSTWSPAGAPTAAAAPGTRGGGGANPPRSPPQTGPGTNTQCHHGTTRK